MIQKIELFLFVLSLVFTSRFLIEFISIIRQDTPTKMEISKPNVVLLYVSVAYILSSIITFFIN